MTRGFGRAAHLVIRHSTVVDTVVANGCASCTVDFEEEEQSLVEREYEVCGYV